MTNAIKKGRFITVEGVEGAGKSTNIGFIEEQLRQAGIKLVCTREPGGTLYSEKIRDLLIAKYNEPLDAMAELLLIFAARAQHIAQFIAPNLKQGNWVLCDRFTDATYAYQGAGRQLGADSVALLETLVQKELKPDATFIFDIPVAQGIQRVTNRGEQDRFEQESLEFFETIRNAYLNLADKDPKRYTLIDSSKSIEQVKIQLDTEIKQRLRTL